MRTLKRLISTAAVAAAVAAVAGTVAGCGGAGGGPPGVVGAGTGGAVALPGTGGAGGGGGAGPMKVPLVDWVTDLAVSYAPDMTPPDTVEDKVDIVIDTSDPAAFNPLLQQQQPAQP